MLLSARFIAPYAGRSGFARRLPMLEVLTIAPPPLRRMSAASAVIAVQCARKFTANCSLDVLVARRVERAGLLDRRAVVERAVEPSVQLLDAVDRRADARAVGEVQGDGVGDAAVGADLGDDPVEGVGAAGGEHDRGALARRRAGPRPPRCRGWRR